MTEWFYRGGGSLPVNFPSYIVREADTKLENLIKEGNFCYILTPRQMGKSSLRVRVSDKLQQQEFACVSIDVSEIGVNNLESADQWYLTLLSAIVKKLKLEKKILLEWWKSNLHLTPVFRFSNFLCEKIIELTSSRVVIFLDEIDSILSIDKRVFNSDDFFACIRSIYNARVDNPAVNRINFVVIGVASPNDLINDVKRTPFNIGSSVQLDNFTFQEAGVLKEGLKNLTTESNALLKKIFYWTNGQPVLTQKLCLSIYKEETAPVKNIPSLVRKHIDKLFLKNNLSDSDNSNLLNIQNRIENDDRYGLQIIDAYKKILTEGSIREVRGNLSQIYLRLTGLVRCVNGFLEINNRIYEKKFNTVWADEVRSKIYRPFNAALEEWADSNKSEEKVLRDQQLNDYNYWCYSRNDLTALEKEFQDHSNNVKTKEEAIAKIRIEEREKSKIKFGEQLREGLKREELSEQSITRILEAFNISEELKAQKIDEIMDQTNKEEELALPEKLQKLREKRNVNIQENKKEPE